MWVAITNIQSQSSKSIFSQKRILLSLIFLWLLHGADLFLSLDFDFYILLLSCCALESTIQLRLSAITIELELELLASHLLPKDMLSLDVTIYSSTPVHTFVPVTLSKIHM